MNIVLPYRPHIDGLRAIAVIAVIIFHLNPSFFPGGYLGVDVFFVISGFVISQSLYKNYLKTGKINIFKFYIQRFWRLYPALISMVSATTFFYIFLGFLWDTNLFIKSSISSIVAVSNFYYLHQAENYFHQNLINPLLHTWSLGIEEQFYFIYPFLLLLVLWVFHKYNINRKNIALVFLLGSMVLYTIFYLSKHSILGDFYFPTARFWELGFGCALFFFSCNFTLKRGVGFLAHSALIVLLGILIFQKYISNLPVELFVVVGATALLIFSGLYYKGGIIKFLAHTYVVYIGSISYSLYLWHLPTIYFSNLYLSGVWYYFFSILGTVLLAVFSYKYIENRFRHYRLSTKMTHRFFFVSLGIGVVLIGYVALVGPSGVIKQINVHLNKFSEQVDSVNYIELQFNLAERIQPGFFLGGSNIAKYCDKNSITYLQEDDGIRTQCLKKVGGESVIYLTGDSHASHFVPMLDTSNTGHDVYFKRFPRRAIVNTSGLPLQTDITIEDRRIELQALSQRYKNTYYITSLFLSNASNQPVVIQQNLEKYIRALSPHATMIFIAPTPVFSTSPESCVILGVHCTLDTVIDQKRRSVVLNIFKKLTEKYKNVYIYDPYKAICPDEVCAIYDAETDFLRYLDDDHLSVEASRALSAPFEDWFTKTFYID